MRYKVFIHDREYSKWSFIPEETSHQEIENPTTNLQVHPTTYKWFNQDIILYDSLQNTFTTTYSYIRNAPEIAGILVLENNRTYGRLSKNGVTKKLLYKCIPNDKHLPVFLIPYDPPIHFSKVFKNKYVVFKYQNWEDVHPQGMLTHTIGDVDNYDCFYEYQLYCKGLHNSLTPFTNKTREHLHVNHIEDILQNTKYNIEDRRHHIRRPITIDPEHSTDFDDALSIHKINNQTHVTIYIANVFIWLDTLNLWKYLTERVSTIYLPDRKRPMLPNILSDKLCSLQKCEDRFALALDIIYDNEHRIIDSSFKTALINVSNNYVYESDSLQKDEQYNLLYDFTRTLDDHITDSHEIVSYWMVKMNSLVGQEMAKHKTGIFRKATVTKSVNETILSDNLSQTAKRTITMWNNVSGEYTLYTPDIEHEIMKISHYTHVTSPIRRIVDLLNQIILYKTQSLVSSLSNDTEELLDKWFQRVSYINTSMRSIRKIQTDCDILYRCMSEPDILKMDHIGVVFDKTENTAVGRFTYMIFIEKLKLLTRLKTDIDYDNYTIQHVRLFLFMDENSLKKKIRLQILPI